MKVPRRRMTQSYLVAVPRAASCRLHKAGQNPDTATGDMATAGEVACPGGEVAFVRAIIRDSLRLRERVSFGFGVYSCCCFCCLPSFCSKPFAHTRTCKNGIHTMVLGVLAHGRLRSMLISSSLPTHARAPPAVPLKGAMVHQHGREEG